MDKIDFKDRNEKIKALVILSKLDKLVKDRYLDYLLYQNDAGDYFYDNLYFNELLNLFPKDSKQEIILFFKFPRDGAEVSKHLES